MANFIQKKILDFQKTYLQAARLQFKLIYKKKNVMNTKFELQMQFL